MKVDVFEARGVRIEIREETETVTTRTSSGSLMRQLAQGKIALPYEKKKATVYRVLRDGRFAGIARKNGKYFVCGRHSALSMRELARKLCGVSG